MLLAAGNWQLATGCWQLAVGYWLLAAGYRLLKRAARSKKPVTLGFGNRSKTKYHEHITGDSGVLQAQ
jgi:hypothetical protein